MPTGRLALCKDWRWRLRSPNQWGSGLHPLDRPARPGTAAGRSGAPAASLLRRRVRPTRSMPTRIIFHSISSLLYRHPVLMSWPTPWPPAIRRCARPPNATSSPTSSLIPSRIVVATRPYRSFLSFEPHASRRRGGHRCRVPRHQRKPGPPAGPRLRRGRRHRAGHRQGRGGGCRRLRRAGAAAQSAPSRRRGRTSARAGRDPRVHARRDLRAAAASDADADQARHAGPSPVDRRRSRPARSATPSSPCPSSARSRRSSTSPR